MANDKTNFNMQLSITQKDIMDFVTEVIYGDYGFSKADAVIDLFRNSALNYLGLEFDGRINDEMIYQLLLEQKRSKDLDLISFMGLAQYEKITANSKEKGLDISYHEGLIKEYKEREVK